MRDTSEKVGMTLKEHVLFFLDCNPAIQLRKNLPYTVRRVDRALNIERLNYDEEHLAEDLKQLNYRLNGSDNPSFVDALYEGSETLQKQRQRILHAVVGLDEAITDNIALTLCLLDYLLSLIAQLYTYSFDIRLVILYIVLNVLHFLLSVLEWCQTWEELWRTNNPQEFDKPGYLNTEDNAKRLDGFQISKHRFKTVRSPRETWRMLLGCVYLRWKSPERYSCLISTRDLHVWMCVPNNLCKPPHQNDKRVSVGVFINIGGGGMVTGHPVDPVWTPQAIIDATLQYGWIYFSVDRRRMPESNGTSIMEDNEHAMHFLFKDDGLKKCVESHYPHLQLDRTKITITAESAGAFLAWDAYRKFGCHFNGLYFRYGLFEPYNRLPGEYMGKEVSFGEAANSLSKSRSLTRRLNEEIPPGIGRPTPISQWAALYLSVTGYWQLIWGRNSPMDSLDEMSSCPNSNMVILFMHGFKDTFSPLDSPQRMVEKLKKWPVDVVLHVLEEEGHGFDYNISLDSPKMKPFAEFARKIDGSSQVAR